MNVVEMVDMKRPHVVLLGAGASRAVLPKGDKNGRVLPVMDDFIEVLGLEYLLDGIDIYTESKNFEDIYSEISSRQECNKVCLLLENAIWNYFYSLELPSYPTIYDYLLLSLRKKDAIATFNWDPLLLKAYSRVSKITDKLPQMLFLHGNVLVGICDKDNKGGFYGSYCPTCGKLYERTKLLYPVKQKQYSNDKFIRDQWNGIRACLKNAFSITIFGYSAPKTDSEAINLLKNAWGPVRTRELEQIEIIDIKTDDELRETWREFIHTHHYETHASYFESSLAKFPRRINEAYWSMLMECLFIDTHEITQGLSFVDLEKEFKELIKY